MTDDFDSDTDRYVRGETYARRDLPRFEFKPSATGYTGGGYARIRSSEYREHTSTRGTDDVFVPVHRIAAVAWHLPDGTLGEDVHLSAMAGVDVHHTQPDRDERGMPAANGEAWTALVEHGRHATITQAEMRAWAADAKRATVGDGGHKLAEGETCTAAGCSAGVDAEVGGRAYCLECAMDRAGETRETIEMD